MLKIKNILILVLLPFAVLCQDRNALFDIWADSSNAVEKRLEAYYEVVNLIQEPPNGNQIENWYQAADNAIALSKETHNEQYIPRFLAFKSAIETFLFSDAEKAQSTAEKALDMALKYKDNQSAIFVINAFLYVPENNLSTKYNEETSLTILENLEKEILNTEESVESIDHLKGIYSVKSQYYYNKSNYPEALRYLQKATSLYKESDKKYGDYAQYLKLLGSIHNDIGNYTIAESYLLDGLLIVKNLNQQAFVGSFYNELSRLYLNLGESSKALDAVINAIAIMEPEVGNLAGCELCVHESYTAEAGVYNLLGDHETALQKLLKTQDYHNNPNSGATSYGYAFYFCEFGTAYLGLKQYQKAIDAANKGLAYSSGTSLNEKKRCLEIIYKARQAEHQYAEALEAFQSFVQTRDSMAVLRNAQEVSLLELENTYQQEELKKEIAFQQSINKEKAKRRTTFAITIFAALIAIFLFYRLKITQKTKNILTQKNKQIESEKEKAKASEKAKHQFLANMSHEIRTPMNAIIGMTEILLRRAPNEDQLRYLNGIKESSDSLLVIINDILDISKIEAGKIDFERIPFSLENAVKNVNTMMQFKAEEKGIELQTKIQENLPLVIGDPSRLSQILLNLIGNAIKFTEKGSVSTTIESSANDKDDELLVHFTISDTGIGIDKDNLQKVFESFEQAYSDTTRKFGGTGLGLSISKKLVEIQNGQIWVESEKGKGSHFHFTVPYPIQQSHAPLEQDVPVSNTETNRQLLTGLSILLVEDNVFNAVVAQDQLEDFIDQAKVVVAQNGEIAVKKVKENNFDVILMDVQMPIMNGYDATKAIRQLSGDKAKTPIIAMTANVLKEEVALCYDAGMDDFIGKPFDPEELIQKIATLTQYL